MMNHKKNMPLVKNHMPMPKQLMNMPKPKQQPVNQPAPLPAPEYSQNCGCGGNSEQRNNIVRRVVVNKRKRK